MSRPVQGTPVRVLNIPWQVLVNRADPQFEQKKRNEVEYEFSNGRQFRGNPATRGAYAQED
jgi:hypothetical protein